MISGDGIDDYFEHEFAAAPSALTSHLYHYTSSEAAILGILANRTIRLSPFQGTNDLWESRPLHPNLEGGSYSDGSRRNVWGIWGEVDRYIRGFSKVACFTQDWDLPDSVLHPDALRGWAHLSLWAHYGGSHTGVCLRFDRVQLLAAFEAARESAVRQFFGPVRYRNAEFGVGPHGISIEQAEEFGIDAVALRYAQVHHERVFFRKHADWASESEFRLVRTDLSTDPYYLDITDALTGVVLGEEFPKERLPALNTMMAGFPDVEVLQARFDNRMLTVWPRTTDLDPGPASRTNSAATSIIEPRRSGDLAERLTLLDEVERIADLNREQAAPTAARVIRLWREGLKAQHGLHTDSTSLVFSLHPGATAIPPRDRQQRPGVSGDVIAHQAGLMIVGEHQPQYSFTWVVALAVQIMADGAGRLHATIETEEWRSGGNDRQELYRDMQYATPDQLLKMSRNVLESLVAALPGARSNFDDLRGETRTTQT